ncbi:hypothetical protein MSAN_02414300 [Mycena sanguinolenta]|uniref:Uncharacterized protein n=1 Tax=Mycena sanguinolenta TaxID=230812 RepID=A0A8H7CFH9_9AGAR|nr:hypothetical protein MSAN_02414300 [Mycena sanguinolenta]
MSDDPRQVKPSWRSNLKEKIKIGWRKLTSKRDKPDAPGPDTAQSKPSSSRQAEDRPDAPGPDTAQSKPSSNKQEDHEADSAASDTAQDDPKPAEARAKLHQWKTDNEDSKGRKLAKAINGFLEWEIVTAAQDFIPDSPFPAKTLVKLVLTIIKLGPHVADIQEQTYDFAAEAIESLDTLVTAANEESDVQEDLEAVRGVVNEICIWASEDVRKKHFSDDDLKEWKTKLEKGEGKTTTLVGIRVAQAKKDRKDSIKEKLTTNFALWDGGYWSEVLVKPEFQA